MLLILVAWCFLVLTFIAWGNILSLFWNKVLNRKDDFDFFDTFWMGLGVVATLSMAISLLLPLNITVLIIFICFTAAYWIYNRKGLIHLWQKFRSYIKACPIWLIVSLSLVIIIIGIWAISFPLAYDNGLYHLQSMIWIENFSAVPGLGNLHGRLAFNSSSLVLTALFSYHPNYYYVFYPINSLCFLIFSIWLFTQLKSNNSPIRLIAIAGIFFFIVVPYSPFLSGTSTDMLPNVIVCYLLFRCLLEKNYFSAKILPIVVASTFCITAKLSTGIISILIICIIIQQIKQKDYKLVVAIITLCLIVILPWFIRNIIQTGYLIYPFPGIDIFSFDWKMPITFVQDEKDWVYYWARVKADYRIVRLMPLSEWFPIWFENRDEKELRFFFLALISPLILLFSLKKIKQNPVVLLIWGIAVLGALYCFFSAPDLRFGWGFFIVAGFVPFLLIDFSKLKKRIFFYTSLIIFFMLSILCFRTAFRHIRNIQRWLDKPYTLLLRPQPHDVVERQNNPEFSSTQVGNTTVYFPTDEDRCFDVCFPCTPMSRLELAKGLEMRGETLQEGFRISKEK